MASKIEKERQARLLEEAKLKEAEARAHAESERARLAAAEKARAEVQAAAAEKARLDAERAQAEENRRLEAALKAEAEAKAKRRAAILAEQARVKAKAEAKASAVAIAEVEAFALLLKKKDPQAIAQFHALQQNTSNDPSAQRPTEPTARIPSVNPLSSSAQVNRSNGTKSAVNNPIVVTEKTEIIAQLQDQAPVAPATVLKETNMEADRHITIPAPSPPYSVMRSPWRGKMRAGIGTALLAFGC